MKPLISFPRRIVARLLEAQVKRLIARKGVRVVAVTGSVGKTSTKLAIAHVLSVKYKVLAHPGNYNSQIGLPLSIFEIDVPKNIMDPLPWLKILSHIPSKIRNYPYQVIVVEMGADKPGEIRAFMKYMNPDIGVVTAIAPVHLEGFGSVEAIAREKMALVRGSKQALVNADDERVVQEAQKLGEHTTYGVHAGEYRLPKDVHLQTLGEHSAYAATAAFAVGKLMGVDQKDIVRQLATLKAAPGRMNMLAGKKGSHIIDDTYNSAPRSALAALETLYSQEGGRCIAILGSMNELGSYAEKAHEEVGAKCGKLDMLLTIGENANEFLAAAAEKAGLAPQNIHRFTSPFAAGLFLDDRLEKGDWVLAKGSQNGVYAEEAVALLLKNPADRLKLVRQSDIWQHRKRHAFGVQ